jgi:hypothetical protein
MSLRSIGRFVFRATPGVVAAGALAISSAPASASVAISTQTVEPSLTGAGITRESQARNYDFVAAPASASDRKAVLVVFLGGATSSPGSYTDVTSEAAGLGYGAIDLRYPNTKLAGSSCSGDDACFTQFRGETSFGEQVAYGPGVGPYDATALSIDRANSVVNRLVSLLDYLAQNDGYWSQFLVPSSASPYTTGHFGHVYPDWSKLVISGHSQGGGDAAFVGTLIPARRVVMFSSPDDDVGGASASWITAPSRTPVTSYWGLRNQNEGLYGSFTSTNWRNLGGAGSGGVGGAPPASAEVLVGDGAGAPNSSQRLVTSTRTGTALGNHDSTAVNGSYRAAVKSAWDYLFTAGFRD